MKALPNIEGGDKSSGDGRRSRDGRPYDDRKGPGVECSAKLLRRLDVALCDYRNVFYGANELGNEGRFERLEVTGVLCVTPHG